jgi:hypothetical protein
MSAPQSSDNPYQHGSLQYMVRDRIPGDDEPSRQHRVALLRIFHASQAASSAAEWIGERLAAYLRDSDGPNLDNAWASAQALADELPREAIPRLETLIAELRKSASTIEDYPRQRALAARKYDDDGRRADRPESLRTDGLREGNPPSGDPERPEDYPF